MEELFKNTCVVLVVAALIMGIIVEVGGFGRKK